MPVINTNGMNKFLEEFKKYLGKRFDSLDKLEDKLVEVLNSLSDDYLRNLTLLHQGGF